MASTALTYCAYALAAAASLLANRAYADTTIVGTVDVFLERTSVPGHAATRLESSGLGVSKLGFRTSERLNADWNASAYLETGVSVDSGASSGFASRMSYLRLNNSWASITVGKQYSPHLLQLAGQYDIYATSFWATPYAFFQGGQRYMLIPDALTLDLSLLADKQLKLSAMWARRESDASAPRGHQRFFSASYTIIPQLQAGLTLVEDEHFSHRSPHARLLLAGFNYEAGQWRVSGGVQTITQEAGMGRINEHCLGVGYSFGASLVQVNYAKSYQPGQAGKHALVFGVSLVHSLSKRTALYSAWGRLNNGSAAQAAFDLPTRVGEPAKNFMLGIKHSF